MLDYKILVVISAGLITVVILLFLAYDYFFHQIKFFKGREYRRKYGKFTFSSYADTSDPIKGSDWLKQGNKGIKPELYKGKNRYINHSKNVECIVSKKGL